MKIHLRGYAYCFTIVLTLLLSATEAKAQFKDTVVYDYGTYSSSCYICGSGYDCFSSIQHLLIGNRAMRLTGLTVKVFHTSCGSGNYYAVLNGDTLGTFSRSNSCACSDCFIDSIEAGPSLLTSYQQTDTNDILFGGIYLCTDKIMVIRTYSSIAMNDAAVLSVDSPGRTCAGSRSIAVSIGNFGRNVIDSVKVRWTWNGLAQTTYNYSGTLDTFGGSGNNKVRITIGSKTLVSGKTDTLKVWTSLPNGVSDTSNYNDTLIRYIRPSFSDTITVGGSNPDYATVQAAINDLQTYGVCAPVVVSIRPGTYNEQLKIGAIPGSDSLKHITFRSSTGDSSDVAIAFSASNSSLNHTLLIENASHIRFSQLTFEAGGTSYAHVVDFKTGFRNISFNNCAFAGYASSGSSSNQALIFNSANTGNSIGLYFTNCDFREGSYAVYFTNSGSASGFRFRNNRMAGQIYSNIYLNYVNNVEISNNDISRLNTSYTYGYGIYMYDNSFVKITGNRIVMPYGGYAIYTDYVYGSNSSRNLIANNFISSGSANYSDAWGWYANYNTYTDFYNNSVYANTLYTGYGNLYVYRGTDIRIRNNSLNMAAPGYLIYHNYSGSSSITQCNNNNFYGNQTQFYHNNLISSLNSWKQTTGFDSASTFSNPNYTSSTDLHVYSVDMSGKAIPDSRIGSDIDGQTRNSSTPDIGADEFDLVQLDAGIDAIQAFVADSVCVFVNLKNHGEDTLTSVQLNWSINGYAKTALSWTGSLLSGKSSSVCIGTHRFSKDSVYTVRTWTSSPNGQADTMNFNDTFVRTGKPALRGIYTIGGSSPDFTTFNAAITAMTDGGIIDSVLFRVRSGSYNERLVIPAITGASRPNAIAFESVSKDSSTVTLFYAGNWTNYEVVHLNGASWVSFRHMTIKNTASSSPMRVFAINNSAGNIIVSNCKIESAVYATTDTYYDALIYTSNQESGLTIKNSRFINGATALYTDNHKRLTIQNNVFENAYYMGLYLYQTTDLIMEKNTISSNSAYTSFYGAYIYYIYGKNKISGNRITGPNKSEYAGLYMYSIQANVAEDSTYIFNNSISVGGSNAQYAVYIYDAENTYFCNNNLHYYSTYTSSHWALRMRYLYNCKVLNNNFTDNGNGSSNGIAAEMYSLSNTEEDHNNYTGTGSNLTYINYTYYASLANMKANGIDSHSLSISPGYFSNTDLHVQTTALNAKGKKLHFVKTDMDGENRDSISPDIGSDEFIPKQRDAGVVAFINPLNIISADTTQIKVAVTNFGLDTLFSFKIRCIINRDTLSSVTVNDTLLSGDSMQVVIGNYIFKRDSINNLSAWTYEPNNGSDQKNSNDTFRIKNKKTAMSGVYTIGGSSPDFPSFKAAANAMYSAGISGWVRFRVRSGTYVEQLRFTPIPGAGSRNSVVFESENLDSTSVTLRYNSTYYDSNYVVFFRGASGITFRHMTITALNGSYGHVFQFEEGASYNALYNNVINGVNTASTSTEMAAVYSGNSSFADEYNEFAYNIIENGSYGMYLYGYGSPQYRERGLKVSNNTFSNQYYMGLRVIYQSSPLVHRNTVRSSSAYTSWYGMYLNVLYNKSFITSNTINRKNNGQYGLFLYDINGSGDTILVANNTVNIGGSNNPYGIYSAYTYYVHLINNTVRVDGTTSATASGFYQDNGSNNYFLNNNIVNTGPGYALTVNNSSSILKSDYNNFKTNGSFLAYWNSTAYSNLQALRSVSNKDSNSISVDPLFYTSDNLHVKNIDLNGRAKKHPMVKTDIDGDLRDTLTPDIGADEFTPPLLDAGVFEISNPKTPFQPDTQYIRVAIKNHGQNTISTLEIGWSFNDTVQSTYSWSGSLASNDTAHVMLGLKYFDPDSAYSVVAWTSLPNNYNDTINDNDTARALNLYPALSGPYTIGGASPDFNTFTDAVNALIRGGIIGQVTFNVRNGTYNEKLLIPAIVGAGSRNSIIFQSENRDSSKVTLVNNSNTSVSNYTVRLSGASGITFRDLTISTSNTSYGRVFELILGASNISLNNNILESANINSTSTNHSIVYIYNGNHTNNSNNQFTGNVFIRGAFGLYNYGYRNNGVYDKNLLISGNTFDQPYYTAVFLNYCDTVSIQGNTIRTGSYTNAFGIYMEYCRGNVNIQKNNIHIPAGYMGIYLYNQSATAAKRSLIANNMISVLGNGNNYGLYFYGSYLDFYNNNIHLNSSNTGSYGAYFTSSSNVRSANNIYNHNGAGYAMYTSSSSALTVSDNNCYRSTGSNLVYWNGNRSNLAALQAANAKDANSISIDPSYVSNSDLHVRAIALDKTGMVLSVIKTDFDGRSRDTLNPDIGADEFDIPSPDDAGISAYIGPVAPFAAGSTPVNVVLTNHGSDTLTTATIHWRMNNVTQTAYSWTGSLKSGTSDTVNIGNFNFSSGILYTLHAWPSSPNGVSDTLYYNDTLKKDKIVSALEGIYTIGGTVPDFVSFAEARDALMLGGVVDTVVFKVRNGTYNEQVQLLAYPGAAANRPVTFTSESGDSTKVTLQYNGNYNYVFSLKGADFVTLSHMTIRNYYYYGGSVVTIDDASNDITVKNNRLLVNNTYYYYYSGACVLSGSDRNDNTRIIGNAMEGGYYGIQLYGGGSSQHETGTLIESNRITNTYASGIYLIFQNAAVIRKNQVNFSSSTGNYLLYLTDASNDVQITYNKLISTYSYTYGIYLSNIQGTTTKKALIANNFVSLADPYYYGVFINSGNYINLYFNSINLYGSNINSASACLNLSSASNADIRNNILSNLAGTYAINSNAVPTASNYNDLYTSGSNLCRINSTNYSNMAAWRSATSRDGNSKSVNPTFFSNTDLHTTLITLDSAATPISGITDDIDGNARNSSKPDIGADEFNSLPNNLSVIAITNPVSACETDSQQLRISIFNYGSNTQKNFPVRYRVNGGSLVTETFTDSILPGTGKAFNFSGKVNTSAYGDYNFVVWTDVSSEQYRLNDTLKRKISNYQTPDSVGTMVPADNITNVAFPFSLSWAPANGATMYDIYIWADSINTRPGTPAYANQTQISRQITGGLGYGVKYKWQVVAKNPSCATDGPVQKFTIRNLPDLIVSVVNAPASAYSGNTISASWSVKNKGSGSTGTTAWYDLVYLSRDNILDNNDLLLTGVLNLNTLNPNQTYNNSANVTLPQGISNYYHIIVRTDAYGYVLETDEGNNILNDSAGMSVSLTPPPDLVVNSLIKPNVAFSGQSINVRYTVKNVGTGNTRATSWRDYIYINPDSTQGGTLMRTVQRNKALDPDSSYTVLATITLPMTISGGYYVHVKTDALNSVYEHASENNNDRISDSMRVILTPPPDLIARNLEATDTASNRESIALKYKLINQGGSPTTTGWYDHIYISKFSTFNANTATHLGQYYRNNLQNDDTLICSQTVVIPDKTAGLQYLFVFTNKEKYQFEGSNDTNNLSPPFPIRILNPDLTVRHVIVPAADSSGKPMRIDWVVMNEGPGKHVTQSRKDKIFISRHSVFHADSCLLVDSVVYNLALNAGDSMKLAKIVTIPNGTSGNRYFYAFADAGNAVFENGLDSNNSGRSNLISIALSPYPDLRVKTLTVPDSSSAGQSAMLSYTVENKGNRTAVKGWKDLVFISKDSAYNPAKLTLLKTNTIVSNLQVDSQYSMVHTLSLPPTMSAGNYYFYVFTDAGDIRYEYQYENNNIRRSKKIFVDGYPPVDLDVLQAGMPDSAYSGTNARIQWKVKNIGQASTIAPEWLDRIYLSADSLLDGSDRFVGETRIVNTLQKDSSYERSIDFMMPNGLSGNFCVIVKSDVRNDNNDDDTLSNIGYSAHLSGAAKYIKVILSKSSDLQITSWSVPSNAISGQPAAFIWKTENKGDTATRTTLWNDRVYLSTDYNIDGNDIILGNKVRNGRLAKNAFYLDTAYFNIPSNASGNYIVIIKTDESDREYEHNAENNNKVASVMTVGAAPPGDLIVSAVSAPSVAVAGKSLNIAYQIKNIGSNPVNGYRTDNIYLSEDTLFDAGDVLFISRQESASLVPNATRNISVSGFANGIKTGFYHALVFTDIKDNINENKDTNNIGYSADIDVRIPDLPLNVLTPDTLFDNRNLYYKLDIPDSLAGESVLITFTGDSASGQNELYARWNDVPSRSKFDFGFSEPYAANQEILIPKAIAGTYYLLAYGNNTAGNRQNIKLLARILEFEIRKVSPVAGGNTGQVTLKIEGSKFDSTTVFTLLKPGSRIQMKPLQVPDSSMMLFNLPDQTPRSVLLVNPALAYVTFDLRGQSPGVYDVLANNETEEAVLEKGFRIVAGSPPNIAVAFESPSSTRGNVTTTFNVVFRNSGNTDMVNGYLEIVSNGGAAISLTLDGLKDHKTTIRIPLEEFNGIDGILRPGGSGTVTIYTTASVTLAFNIIIPN